MANKTFPYTAKATTIIGVTLFTFFLGGIFLSIFFQSTKIADLFEKNRAEIESVKDSIQQLVAELKSPSKADPAESVSNPSLPSGIDGKLARLLVTNSKEEKQKLTEERLTGAKSHAKISSENVHFIASDLQAMNAILSSPEQLDSTILDRVENERDRLLELLRTQIPPLVKVLDEMAVKEPDTKEALGIWAKGGALLGYYPSSNIPKEAETIQKIVTDHEVIRTRIALLQKQRYNVWASEYIKKAWQDFADPNIPSNKAKMETCKRFLGPIETSYLEPITMELYRDFLDAIKKKVSSEDYQSLAASIANANRITPGEKESAK